MKYPASNFTSDFYGIGVTCNDRIALIVVKWLSFTDSSFYEKEDRTRGLTVHYLTPCLRRH